MDFPKILILIQPFTNNTGGGITLSNLFKGWPKNKLAVASLPGLINTNIVTDICDTYYQLGEKEMTWKFPFNMIKRKYTSGLLDFHNHSVQEIVPKKSKLRSRVLINYVEPSLKWLGLMETIYKLDLSEKFCKWLDEYQPDIIYAQAHGRNRVRFCSRVKQYTNKPMVFHMMDDWPEFVRGESIFGKYWEKVVDKEFKKLLEVSDLHLGISELMEVEYLRRYNIQFKAFHNPIDFDFWKKGQKSNWQINGEYPKILYAGRMGLGIEKSLKLLAEAISIINKKSGRSIQFILQVAEKKKWMNKFKCIKHRPFVPYEQLPEKFGEADILYLPYDFSEKAVKFIKYSMPTKASEYMISGTPILIFAPGDTALVNYAEKYHWAKVVKDENIEELVNSVEKLLDCPEERERYGKSAILLAKDKHEAFKVRNDFRKALISVIE
ncbi:glycosyltransferase [Cyclobacterium plantarum]|uniref:Glycosyltransferase family 4 protein n=1 Tax=Cyclobacterium plantarum TaxID=2716263 RepID=A0ABX0H5N1_9BACT|nr:glycosyltransferase [Cyclobacterium plantarum]NHE55552.1 glycosyltransferase family 4 protein [Cyclobacterium plantarum]